MPYKNGAALDGIVVDSHEDRLQRLEAEYPDLKSQLAQCVTEIVHVKEGIESTRDTLGKKLDALTNVIDANTKAVEHRLDALEETKRKVESLKGILSKLLIPILIVGSALLGKFGESLFDKFFN